MNRKHLRRKAFFYSDWYFAVVRPFTPTLSIDSICGTSSLRFVRLRLLVPLLRMVGLATVGHAVSPIPIHRAFLKMSEVCNLQMVQNHYLTLFSALQNMLASFQDGCCFHL